MKRLAYIVLMAALPATALTADPADPVRIELNTAAGGADACRLSFVVENKGAAPLTSLKLDLVMFDNQGAIDRRLVTEMGPLRGAKTVVKTFEVERGCADLGAILVNGVTACAPDGPDACLDRLTLTSRLPNVRLFK
jgi:hypothetical protein